MPKIIHTMIRVLDPVRSQQFYTEGFGFFVSHRLDFDDFSLIYLRNPENDFEIELTHNFSRTEPYTPYVRIDVASIESHQPYWGRSKDMQ